MIRKILLPAVLMTTLALPAFASERVELTEANTTKIKTMLTEQGYEVVRIKLDDGYYEVYARKDGHRYEIELDAAFGIVELEREDKD